MATCIDDMAHAYCLIKIIPLDSCFTHLNINNLNILDYSLIIVVIRYVSHINGSEWRHGSKIKYFCILNLTFTITLTLNNSWPWLTLTVTLKALDALKHIFQSDVIIIDNDGSLFIWESYRNLWTLPYHENL